MPSDFFRLLFKLQFVVMIGLYSYMGTADVSGTAVENFNDLLLHSMGYFVAIFSGFLAFHSLKRFFWVVVGLWLFSLFIEIVQYHLPWRSFSLLDLVANSLGLLVGYGVLWLLKNPILKIIGFFDNRVKASNDVYE